MEKGILFVVSGPSGVGKGTIMEAVSKARGEDMVVSVSATTRQPRPGETDGVSYFFLTEEEFFEKRDANGFIEFALVHGSWYGTPKDWVEARLAEGRDVILEIDVQGALQVKEYTRDASYIFILPPSLRELRRRITERGTETDEQIRIRMNKVMEEIEHLDRYDYAIVNDDLDKAVEEMLTLMKTGRNRLKSDVYDIIESYREEI
ncbi:MAG: guanylate kinase [Firmicutes bacterium]|nr:guanylate kinase [Bacillota bacterium]